MMTIRNVLMVLVVALILTPVALFGVVLLIPVGLLLLVAVPIACVAALPALLVWAAHEPPPGDPHRHGPMPNAVAYHR